MKVVDLLLLENTQVKNRSHKCYAIAKCGIVENDNLVYAGKTDALHRIISIARDVPMNVIDMIQVKNHIHTVSRVASVTVVDIPEF